MNFFMKGRYALTLFLIILFSVTIIKKSRRPIGSEILEPSLNNSSAIKNDSPLAEDLPKPESVKISPVNKKAVEVSKVLENDPVLEKAPEIPAVKAPPSIAEVKSKSRLLELYPELKTASLFDLLGKLSATEFKPKEGTLKNDGTASDGTTVMEYETADGAKVTEWLHETGSGGTETIEFSPQEKVTRWFPNDSRGPDIVQYDNGPKGGLIYYDDFGKPSAMRSWRSENGPETRIEF